MKVVLIRFITNLTILTFINVIISFFNPEFFIFSSIFWFVFGCALSEYAFYLIFGHHIFCYNDYNCLHCKFDNLNAQYLKENFCIHKYSIDKYKCPCMAVKEDIQNKKEARG